MKLTKPKDLWAGQGDWKDVPGGNRGNKNKQYRKVNAALNERSKNEKRIFSKHQRRIDQLAHIKDPKRETPKEKTYRDTLTRLLKSKNMHRRFSRHKAAKEGEHKEKENRR